jgi:hypothetical protein
MRLHIEVGLDLSLAAGPKMLCLCFYVFFNWPGDLIHLGSVGRQADEYIAPGGKLFMFFMYLILPMNQVRKCQNQDTFGVMITVCRGLRSGLSALWGKKIKSQRSNIACLN